MHHKIILVDDEPNILMGLQRALRKEPYKIFTALSGNEALTVLEKTPIDVVVSDQDMPGMNGTEFLTQVHKSYPDTVRFMLTGKATLEVAIQAINEGAINRFFTKPCNNVDLAVTIRSALQQRDLMIEARRLLREFKQQSGLLGTIEEEYPGITQVKRDSRGAIIVDDDIPKDYDQLIEELQKAYSIDDEGVQ